MISMEENIYEMENIQLDLVNNLKGVQLANERLEDKIEQVLRGNEELEKK